MHGKRDENWSTSRYRSRLVAKGFNLRNEIRYDQVFSLVTKYTALWYVLCIVGAKGLQMLQLDLKAAFLNGELGEDIYMEQPQRFVVVGKGEYVYRLHRAQYGLKQS